MTRHAAWASYANAVLARHVFTVLGPASIAQAALGSSSATGDAAVGVTSQEAAAQPAGDDDRDRCDRFDRFCCDRFDPWCDKDDRCHPFDPWCDKDDRCHPFDPWCDKDLDSTPRTSEVTKADVSPVLVTQLL